MVKSQTIASNIGYLLDYPYVGRGLLEEILTSHDEEERENKFRNRPGIGQTGEVDELTPHR